MFVFLSKFLPVFFYPVGLVWLLLLGGLLARRRPRLLQVTALLALIILWIGGNDWVAESLTRSLEWRYLPPAELPEVEAIVVLGGGTDSYPPPRPWVEVNGAGDRVIHAARLYRQGKAPMLILSGGNIDWLSTRMQTPAEEMATLLDLMGVPPEAMVLQTRSRNTYEDALFSSELLRERGIERILLVTSAFHMPRSVALFRHTGLDVIPAPVDFSVTEASWRDLTSGDLRGRMLGFFPSAGNLSQTSNAIKEYLGILVYRLRGWV